MTISEATIRADIFKTVWGLINTNKPSGWTVLSAWPEEKDNSETELPLPMIIVSPVTIAFEYLCINASGNKEYMGEMIIEIYSKYQDQLSKVDEGRDNIHTTLRTNESTLRDDGLELIKVNDSNVEPLTLTGRDRLNTSETIVRFNYYV